MPGVPTRSETKSAAVDHQARQPVRLGVHQPHRVRPREQRVAPPAADRLDQPRRQELAQLGLVLAEREDAHPQLGIGVEIPEAQQLPGLALDRHQIAGAGIALDPQHAAREQPGMPERDRAVTSAAQHDASRGHQ